jgi:predicted RNA-binding protein YlqC (UPF0109 family)
VLEEALEHLVRGIVDHPDDVQVVSRMLRRGNVLEVRVHPEDLGKVIGRGGRTARALRTVVGSLAGNRHVRIDLLETGEVRLSPGEADFPHGGLPPPIPPGPRTSRLQAR